MKEPHQMQHYYEPNDAYFRKHLQKGGQGSWGKMGCDSRRFSDRYLR